VLIVARGVLSDHYFERAGYMAYLSLLYLIPLVAIMLALAEALGWGRAALEFVVEKLSITAPELGERLYDTISRLDFVALGLVAMIVIVIAGFVALNKFEGMVDEVWLSPERRPLWLTLALYPLLIVGAPTVAALVLAIGAVAKAQTAALIVVLPQATRFGELIYNRLQELTIILRITPPVLICALLGLIYFVVPSGRVRWQAAAIGGVVAGLAWYVAQGFYLNFQFATGTFRAAWGYLAQIPLLFVWMYVNWLIILLGVEVSFAWQHRHTYQPKSPTGLLSAAAREQALVEIARLLVATRDEAPQGLSSETISNRLRIPWGLVRRHISGLTDIGAVHTHRSRAELQHFAAGDLGSWTIGDLLTRWRRAGAELPEHRRHQQTWRDELTLLESLQK
jgi:membrane protein